MTVTCRQWMRRLAGVKTSKRAASQDPEYGPLTPEKVIERLNLVLELAVAARCSHILTHNLKDFRGIESFGIAAITPGDFYRLTQTLP